MFQLFNFYFYDFYLFLVYSVDYQEIKNLKIGITD